MTICTKEIFLSINGVEILKNVSLEINEGEILTILGPNGAGKSTIVNVLSGDITPQNGHTYYDERPIDSISIQERAFTRSVMSQIQPIVFDFSVKAIIQMGWLDRGYAAYSNDYEDAINKVIRECEVQDLVDRNFTHLSGGEQRRVCFARALLQLWRPSNSKEPRYLFLDEPTANLDLAHEIKILNLIKSKAEEGVGIVMVLHDLNLANRFSHRVVILKKGEVVGYGKPEVVLSEELLSSTYGLPINIDITSNIITYY
ncbi:MAG: heme ABC transporter ATP-binding protein [Gammaproteobacteria bacterium]|jgi:iron complex transport system ATP-binding protein|nr:heme ABC transporter ATP-binding protein [Gammaproteobacteria bacterium]|tara:strand:+ start:1224 stop:1997 length:774 start_codon:yes stop_codon:yes gene_type:complete